MDEVNKLKAGYARAIDDGRKIETFTSIPEWQWYVEHVLKPTIEENTQQILSGKLSDKEDLVKRGVIQGLKMVIDGTTGFKQSKEQAIKLAQKLQEDLKDAE